MERKRASDTELTKKKKRKHDKLTSDKSDVISSAKRDAVDISTDAEVEFVPHDYDKANLTSLLEGT